MKYDMVIVGVGGQGALSLAAIIASAAFEAGLYVNQSELHGMSQRGGAVSSDLRISDEPIQSSTIPHGTADMILSMEPLESLRYLDYLGEGGIVLSADKPVKNIPNYPDVDAVLTAIKGLPNARVIEAAKLARKAGSVRATNVIMVGAASDYIPIDSEHIAGAIAKLFERKGEKVVEINRKAFLAGREAGS